MNHDKNQSFTKDGFMAYFNHLGKQYKVEMLARSIYAFSIECAPGCGFSRLFTTVIHGPVSDRIFIQELIDRANQRQSALDNTFHLNP